MTIAVMTINMYLRFIVYDSTVMLSVGVSVNSSIKEQFKNLWAVCLWECQHRGISSSRLLLGKNSRKKGRSSSCSVSNIRLTSMTTLGNAIHPLCFSIKHSLHRLKMMSCKPSNVQINRVNSKAVKSITVEWARIRRLDQSQSHAQTSELQGKPSEVEVRPTVAEWVRSRAECSRVNCIPSWKHCEPSR